MNSRLNKYQCPWHSITSNLILVDKPLFPVTLFWNVLSCSPTICVRQSSTILNTFGSQRNIWMKTSHTLN
jgi:hypothetical protein